MRTDNVGPFGFRCCLGLKQLEGLGFGAKLESWVLGILGCRFEGSAGLRDV